MAPKTMPCTRRLPACKSRIEIWVGAEASLQKALQLNPANLDALILLAMEELRGRTHQAEDVYRRALQLDPNYAQRQTILPI